MTSPQKRTIDDWWYFHYRYAYANRQDIKVHKKGGLDLFYEQLKEVCEKKGTNPTAVCLAIGISKSNATEWKKGRTPKVEILVAVANHLGVSPVKLLPKKE